jgi:hypothetical protein
VTCSTNQGSGQSCSTGSLAGAANLSGGTCSTTGAGGTYSAPLPPNQCSVSNAVNQGNNNPSSNKSCSSSSQNGEFCSAQSAMDQCSVAGSGGKGLNNQCTTMGPVLNYQNNTVTCSAMAPAQANQCSVIGGVGGTTQSGQNSTVSCNSN